MNTIKISTNSHDPESYCRLYQRPAATSIPLPTKQATEQVRHLLDTHIKCAVHIGCGVGRHPIAHAQSEPHTLVIAIEHTKEKFGKMIRQIQQESTMANLLPIHGNAITWIYDLIPDESLDHVLLMYPNPEFQNQTKRWVRMPFFRNLILKVKPRGTIQMATNIDWYMKEFRTLSSNKWCLTEIHYKEFYTVMPLMARTHFEEKYLKRGERCYDILVEKNVSSNHSIETELHM